MAKLVREGKRVVIVDCTQGEQGTRGTVQERMEEACKAAEILGVERREVLTIPDGSVGSSPEHVLRIIEVLRRYRPKMLLMPPAFERHPDHEAVHRLCREAYFKSGLSKVQTFDGEVLQDPFRPRVMFAYIQAYHQQAHFYVDVSDTHEIKMEAVRAFGSQVHTDAGVNRADPQTFISSPAFMQMLESRSRYFGALIGATHAEAFQTIEPLHLSSLSHML